MARDQILIVGASARATAFSALRAGLRPSCIDLFADADLSLRVPVRRIAAADYPRGLPTLMRSVPDMPWLYTGALENHAALVHKIAEERPLWGNDSEALASARSPKMLRSLFEEAGLCSPNLCMTGDALPTEGNWLLKLLKSAGGAGIKHWTPGGFFPETHYLQQLIEGEPCSAVYVGAGQRARLLGVTRQLAGVSWLNGTGFQYCGSIGPMPLSEMTQDVFEQIGDALAGACRLRGLFGVDAMVKDGAPWPIEVNPRYTASVEVLEYALGISALALHRACFEPGACIPASRAKRSCVGKAIMYARAPLRFPQRGPWLESLETDIPNRQMPDYADIPMAGETIDKGHPIFTMLAEARTSEEVLEKLRRRADDLDRLRFDG